MSNGHSHSLEDGSVGEKRDQPPVDVDVKVKPRASLDNGNGNTGNGNGTVPRAPSLGSTQRQNSARSNGSRGSRASRARRRKEKEELIDVWPDPHKYNPRSFFLFPLDGIVRKVAIRCIEWKWWDRIVLFLIFLNTIQLAIYNPFDIPLLKPTSPFRDSLEVIGKVFSLLFTLECMVKLVALGLIWGEKTYLKDAFNYLDLFIVIIGVLDFFPSGGGGTGNLSALRSLRVMRPLRAVTKFPDLRFLVILLLQCVPMLSNVLGLCCFIFFVFGILGVQLYAGALRGVCFNIEDGLVGDPSPMPCSSSGGGAALCPSNYECLTLGENPSQGVTHFDGIGPAIMTIFQVMTLEGWYELMNMVQDAYSPALFVYFVVLIFLGPIFAIQLFLVVISTQYADSMEALKAMEPAKIVEANAVGDLPPMDGGERRISQVYPEPLDAGTTAARRDSIPKENGLPTENGESGGKPGESGEKPVENAEKGGMPGKNGTGPESENGGGPPANRRRASLTGAEMMPNGKKGKRKKKWWKRALHKVEELAKSDALGNFIMAMIVLNTFFMGIDHKCDLCNQGYCARYKAFLEGTNLCFAAIFLAEMLIKIVGLGPKDYFTNKMNVFDAVIVVVSLLEVEAVSATSSCLWNTPTPFVEPPCIDYDKCSGGGGGVTVLRTFRLVRIVKLLRAFPDVQKQVRIIVSILGSVAALIALIFIFMLIFCILGMNIFGGMVVEEWDPEVIARGAFVYVAFPGDDLPGLYGRHGVVVDVDPFDHPSTPWKVEITWGTDPEVYNQLGINPEGYVWVTDQDSVSIGDAAITGVVPRFHYDDLFHASITTFQILTTANWNDVLYNHVASTGAGSAFYFYSIIVLGNWMLLNLFIAILIQGFATQKAAQLAANMELMQKQFVEKLGHLDEENLALKMEELFIEMDEDHSGVIEKRELQKILESLSVTLRAKELTDLFRKYDQDGSGEIDFTEFLALIKDLLGQSKSAILVGGDGGSALEEAQKLHEKHTEEQIQAGELHRPDERVRSLYFLKPDNRFRVLCSRIAESKPFDNIVLACILTSSVTLAIESPTIGDDSPLRLALTIIDLVLNGVFTLELCLKVIAQSFKKYIKSGWNKLDFIIVSTSALDMVFTYVLSGMNIDVGVLKIFRTFRILRALRPLRIIARARGLRILVSTIMSAVKPVMNTMGIALGVFCVFGILGMQVLMGKMNSCADVTIVHQKDCDPRDWQTYPVNFDNLYFAVKSMFILATQDDWPDHMFAGVDATSEKEGPYQNNNPFLALYYIASILIAGYLVINIFVGVFVDCYNSAATEIEGTKVEKIKANQLPPIFEDPSSPGRLEVMSIVTTTAFDIFIAFFIVTNVLSMAFESFKQSDFQNQFAIVTNFFFTFIFGWECIFKIYANHPRRYFVNGWNKFDFFIVMISYLGIAVDNLGTSVGVNPTVLRVLRVFRIFRILRAFRIFKAAKGLQAIIATLANSLSALMNLFGMLALVFFIFSVLGITIFGGICTDGDQGQPGYQAVACLFTDPDLMFQPHAHFKGIGVALLTLFRVATGDAWGELLDAAQVAPGSRVVSDSAWESFNGLMETVPAAELQVFEKNFMEVTGETFELTRDAAALPLNIASIAIWRWHAAVSGLEDDLAWPYPGSAPEGEEWMAVATNVLPSCLDEREVLHLEALGLADCSVGGYKKACASTCGSPIGGFLFFSLFVCLAAFVLLQLVIAVLMEQLNAEEDDKSAGNVLMPGATTLRRQVFDRLYRRWRWNAARVLRNRKQRFERRTSGQSLQGAQKAREFDDLETVSHSKDLIEPPVLQPLGGNGFSPMAGKTPALGERMLS